MIMKGSLFYLLIILKLLIKILIIKVNNYFNYKTIINYRNVIQRLSSR